MRFIISVIDLSQILVKLQNLVAQKATIPILANILIEAKPEGIILTATDLTVGIRCFAEAKVLEPGATTLPAKKFTQLIRELTAPHAEITTNEQDVTEVVAGSSRFKLHGMSKKEFPSLPELAEATQFTIPQSDLKDMFFRTSFAVSREDNRYVLTGVLMSINKGCATFVGTDGKRLAKNQIQTQIDPAFKGNYIIPLKAVEEIVKNLREDGDAKVYLMADKVAIEANHSILITKLLSGDFPDVDRIIPTTLSQYLSIHKEELVSLLRQISLFTTEGNQSVRFSFTPGELRLSANAMEIGEGHVSMPVNYQGDHLDIAFNPGFFLDILRHSKQETLSMGIIDGFNPVVIREEQKQEGQRPDNSLCLLMPMRFES